MRFSFMTFSCPELTWPEVLGVAKRFGYDGVEPRAQAKHAHGIETTATPAQRAELRRMAEDAGIAVACLATSCSYTAPTAGELSRMMADSRALIALAHDLGAPTMRVFGGVIPKGMSRDEATHQVADCLSQLAEEARVAGVALCVETHDSWCDARDLARVLSLVAHPSVRANWDIMHPVNAAGMTMDAAFAALRPFIRHVHFHDGKRNDKGGLDLCPIGTGIIDHRRAVQLLQSVDFQGHLSGEWIAWEPWQTHLPRELATMKSYLA
ncbi:MAG TPA: sugar phosphate isomerase/epimerase family protein [Planctomycetota bacterium]|nr:sugar phosphate isomerase/epimerase family protein [Planctomycetota bacterium]HRR81781.1 sugar phosphate isomerase/epimerase family protein [Planctomycetota bacterium]HRT96768.1 sugar phosphate isomerase/epimerase family protein [Planctomycetota bacterium]